MRNRMWLLGLIVLGAVGVGWFFLRPAGSTDSPRASPSAVASASPSAPSTPVASMEATPSPAASPSESAPPSASATPLPPPPPVDANSALAGLSTRELTANDRVELRLPEKLWGGVVVTEVSPTSPGAEAHIAQGDVIFRAGGAKITNWDELARAIGDREQTRVQAYRGGQAFEVVLQRPFVPKAN